MDKKRIFDFKTQLELFRIGALKIQEKNSDFVKKIRRENPLFDITQSYEISRSTSPPSLVVYGFLNPEIDRDLATLHAEIFLRDL